jgi:hypothetical protein
MGSVRGLGGSRIETDTGLMSGYAVGVYCLFLHHSFRNG